MISQRSDSVTAATTTTTTATIIKINDGSNQCQGEGHGYKVKITDLPEEIIVKLEELVPFDFKSLMHVSSLLFAMKGRWHHYKFNREYSRQYCGSQAFRGHVHDRIGDISKRLSLRLSDCDNIRDVSALGGVHTLDLS